MIGPDKLLSFGNSKFKRPLGCLEMSKMSSRTRSKIGVYSNESSSDPRKSPCQMPLNPEKVKDKFTYHRHDLGMHDFKRSAPRTFFY